MIDLNFCLTVGSEYLDSYRLMKEAENDLSSAKQRHLDLQKVIVSFLQSITDPTDPSLKEVEERLQAKLSEIIQEIKKAENKIKMYKEELDALFGQLKSNGCLG